MFQLSSLRIANKEVLPLIEGGKGVSISTGQTSGAWAACGAIGTFSAVNADSFDEKGNIVPQIFHGKTRAERARELIEYAVKGGIAQAKVAYEKSNGSGLVFMNVLWEMGGCAEILERILEKAKDCVHGVVCGAGMPYDLAEITSKFGVYYCPIVSSARAFSALFRRSYKKFVDFLGGVVYEDPWLAGGHNGLSNAENPEQPANPYLRLVELRKTMNEFGLSAIPIIIAGGVWWLSEWADYINNPEIGNVAFQFGTRPILTQESPVAKHWYPKLMSLKKGDIKLTRLSPTGFYSSAINNKMLADLLERQERQVAINENSSLSVDVFGKNIFVDENRKADIENWIANGFTTAMLTPDNTVVFVTPEQKIQILQDQKNCRCCLSPCRFSSWPQSNGTTGKIPDPRSFCIQNSLQNIAHGGDLEENLMFSGHLGYRFAEDPFYANGFIPTVGQLIERIQTGY